MFQNAAIDVAIGLILMYLVLSLVCTVINEFIATQLDLRAKSLAAGLRQLLDDPVVRNAFYDHGLIAGTERALEKGAPLFAGPAKSAPDKAEDARQKAPVAPAERNVVPDPPAVLPARATQEKTAAGAEKTVAASPAMAPEADSQPGKHPSYFSAETFALALIGSVTGTRVAKDQPVPTFADVKSSIEALPPSKVKSALMSSLLASEGKLEDFRKTVATWFDNSMERLSGAYKRNLKLISLVIGILVAIVVNADTFRVGSALWSDAALRAQMVQVAQDMVKQGPPRPSQPGNPPANQSANPPGDSAANPPGNPAANPPGNPGGNQNANPLADVRTHFQKAEQTLRPLPIGWHLEADDWKLPNSSGEWGRRVLKWIVIIAGWLVTGLALSLGAPFWFDLLSKFINIRGTGPKPKRNDE